MHVSGHASAGELLYCYNIVKPRNVMPVHGEIRHLHRERGAGRPDRRTGERVVVAEDGVVVDLDRRRGQGRRQGATAGTCTSTARPSATSPRPTLKDRRILGEEGFISIIVVVDSVTGKIVAGPEIHARGFAEDDAVFDDIKPQIEAALDEAIGQRRGRHATSCSR